jgi:hypothetical protein
MEPRQIIGTGITASAIAHLSVLALVIFFTEVHPFSSVAPEPIAVDLVSPAEVKPSPDKDEPLATPKAEPSEAFNLSSNPGSQPAPSASPPPVAPAMAAAQPQQQSKQQAAAPPPRASQRQTNARPQKTKPQPPSPSQQPAYTSPEPDLTVRYGVMLGLPSQLPANRPQGKSEDGFDAPASASADIASSLIAEFRRHLKTCSKLPAAIAPSDEIEIKLRVVMTPEGRLAAEPVPIGVKHPSENGPALLQSAITALHACEPYQMLPAERYGEWKVLDLSFTTQDFVGD